ncbi:MAG TPA: universal stress protein [Ktedonobacterales bacterium]|jgi:nucleotide-binding universal stress UspA family protein|nr:universal stress protein [Ktedonobacterales bacterium]
MAQADGHVILTPLDGSEMSEFAVPYTAEVARALGATVLIARIVERTRWSAASSGYMMSPGAYTELLELDERDAQAQTHRVVERLTAQGVAARGLVEDADLPADLIDIERREHVSLVVMATHARSGLARVTLGSVADQLVRHGRCPTLLVRAHGALPERPALARALIPLDGSAVSELALAELANVAGTLVKQVTLLRVIGPEERSGASAEGHRALEAARERVERASESLRGQVKTLVMWGQVAQQVLDESARHDLIIMATHGAGGATRWAFGSVADQVLSEAQAPLLLTRPHHKP